MPRKGHSISSRERPAVAFGAWTATAGCGGCRSSTPITLCPLGTIRGGRWGFLRVLPREIACLFSVRVWFKSPSSHSWTLAFSRPWRELPLRRRPPGGNLASAAPPNSVESSSAKRSSSLVSFRRDPLAVVTLERRVGDARRSSADDEYLRLTLSANLQAEGHPTAGLVFETAWRGLQRQQAPTSYARSRPTWR
jgi:hypothetical protein